MREIVLLKKGPSLAVKQKPNEALRKTMEVQNDPEEYETYLEIVEFDFTCSTFGFQNNWWAKLEPRPSFSYKEISKIETERR